MKSTKFIGWPTGIGIGAFALLIALIGLRAAFNEPANDPVAERQDDVNDIATLPSFTAPVQTVAAKKSRPVVELERGFEGSSSCVECHQQQHGSWHESFHRTMTQLVNSETAPDCIRDQSVTIEDQSFHFQQDGDEFYVTFLDPLVGRQQRRRKLVMMTGSHHMHVFWYQSDVTGTPGQLDIVYLIDQQKWIPRKSSFLQPPRESNVIELGTWNRTCSRCHSTFPRERYQEANEDWNTHVAEFGIACESCHGPAEAHVKFHRVKQQAAQSDSGSDDSASGTLADGSVDPITNPDSLTKQASADVCGQCHSVYVPDYDVVSQQDYMRDGNPFRPGDRLKDLDFNKVVLASEEHRNEAAFQQWSKHDEFSGSFWSDGMIRVAGREYNGLLESACFQRGDMTCLSCHDMHPADADRDLTSWRDDQLQDAMRGDQACLQCHSDFKEDIAAHTHHAVDSQGSRCMNCHMPHSTFGLLKTIRSHQISSPTIKSAKGSDRATACSLCHLDQSFQWAADNLAQWYGQEQEDKAQPDGQPISTMVLHLTSGDAVQRAVAASAMGWPPAQEASGTDWMEPYLLLALNDPYDAVRLVAAKTLATLPKRVTAEVDPLAPEEQRMQAFNDGIGKFESEVKLTPNPSLLIDQNGHVEFEKVMQLLQRRNHRPIFLHE
ncbi:MAG: ammonia-forming cytochrome c nitrite reductase subunit c552 [Rubripirellula sp.]